MLKQLAGGANWYASPAATLSSLNTSVGSIQSEISTINSNAIVKDGSVVFTADQSMGGFKVTNLAAPTDDNDAARKGFVDAQDAATLSSANTYADGVGSSTLASANSYADGVGASTLTSANAYADTVSAQALADANVYADAGLALKLNLSGGTMSGPINMGSAKITNLGAPTNAADAASKAYVDGVATGLHFKAPVKVKYDFAGGSSPDVPPLPTEPAAPTFGGTVHTVTDQASFDSALAAAVDGDSLFVPVSTTITLTAAKTINKSIRIYGGSKTSSVITTSAAIAANSGMLIVSGTKSGGAQNNNVQIDTLTLTSTSNVNDHAVILANTLSTSFNNGSTGLRFQDLIVNNTEFGIVVAADSWVIKGVEFNYLPVTGASDTARHIGVYNISTMGWVENCDFRCTTEATPRSIGMLLTASDYDFTPGATKSGGYSGNFVQKGCTQSSGNLRQWLVMEVFKANGLNSASMPTAGFSFWAINNSHGSSSSGSYILFEGAGTKAPLSFFDTMYFSGNSMGESSGTKKGMIAVDGLGAARSAGAPAHLYVSAANSGTAITGTLSGTYVQGCTDNNGSSPALSPVQGNLLAVNSTFFNAPSPASRISLEATSSGGPLAPSGLITVDGVALSADDRVLVIDATDAINSGVYLAASGDWARSSDMADGSNAASAFTFVEQGTVYADTSWVCTSDSGDAVVGTDDLAFQQFGAATVYTAGAGLSLAGNEFSVASGGISNSMLANSSVTQAKLSLVPPVSGTDAVTLSYLDSQLALKLSLTGGAMSGTLDMGGNDIGGLPAAPAGTYSAASKAYVDAQDALKLSLTGGNLSGALGMGNNKITSLATPTVSSDAASKGYVDSALSTGLADKVAKTGDTMTGALLIDAGVALPALGVTGGVTVSDIADGQFLEINTSLHQMTFSVAGQPYATIIDEYEVVISDTTSGGPSADALTNVEAGVIKLNKLGVPAVPLNDDEVAVKKYVDDQDAATLAAANAYADTELANKVSKVGDTMTGNLIVQAANIEVQDDDGTRQIQVANTSGVSEKAIMGTGYVSLEKFDPAGTLQGFYAHNQFYLHNAASDNRIQAEIDLTTPGVFLSLTNAGSAALPVLPEHVTTKQYVDDQTALSIPLSGGTMSGVLDMGGNGITNLADPVNNQDAATKAWVLANSSARSVRVFADVTAAVSANADVGGVGGGSNLSGQLPDMSSGSFVDDYDVFLNGMLLRPGLNSGTDNDYYPGTSLVNGQLKFEFGLDVADVVCVVSYN